MTLKEQFEAHWLEITNGKRGMSSDDKVIAEYFYCRGRADGAVAVGNAVKESPACAA